MYYVCEPVFIDILSVRCAHWFYMFVGDTGVVSNDYAVYDDRGSV